MAKKKKIDEEIKQSLKDIVTQCDKEDEFVRRAQIKSWKKNEEFYHGVQYLFWNEKDQTWISPESGAAPNLGFSEEEMGELGPYYDFVINIFLAHGQSIISALSTQLPSVKFIPDNAEDDDDVDTARTYDKVAELIARHNNAKLKFLQTLFFCWNDGLVAAYRYPETSKKFGTYKVPVFESKEIINLSCPDCGFSLEQKEESEKEETTEVPEQESDDELEQQKITDDSEEAKSENEDETEEKDEGQEQESEPVQCPNCGQSIVPEETKEIIPIYVRDEEKPKSRIKYEIYGPKFVKVPIYAFDQDGCGYLGFYLDKPKDELVAALCYDEDGKLDEELARKIESEYMVNDDRWARSEYQYPTGPEMENKTMTTLIQYWLRPSKFNLEKDLKKREKLLKDYPLGCKVVLVGRNKTFISAKEEELDKRWTVGKAALSTYIHSDPWCQPLVSIQEMRNQLDNLIMDTIEHGIPSTFADSETIDFDAYGKFEALPGYMFKAKARPGKTLGEMFYTEQKASVSREVGVFRTALDKDAQFTVGSFPSLYGGPSEGKSRTLGEYQQSRQQALQRLTIYLTFVSDFYRRNMEELVRMFADMMIEDEHYTKIEQGNYLTIWIRKSQMSGSVGGVETEVSDAFPMTMQQKQLLITKFIEMNNPQLNAALYAPENRKVLQEIFMMNELVMPGAGQIYKQICELNEMMKGQGPIAPGISSVPIDPLVDDDAIHISKCKDWAVSNVGLDVKKTNPKAYSDVEAHIMMHQKNLQLKTMTPFENTPPGVPPDTSETSEAGGDE